MSGVGERESRANIAGRRGCRRPVIIGEKIVRAGMGPGRFTRGTNHGMFSPLLGVISLKEQEPVCC